MNRRCPMRAACPPRRLLLGHLRLEFRKCARSFWMSRDTNHARVRRRPTLRNFRQLRGEVVIKVRLAITASLQYQRCQSVFVGNFALPSIISSPMSESGDFGVARTISALEPSVRANAEKSRPWRRPPSHPTHPVEITSVRNCDPCNFPPPSTAPKSFWRTWSSLEQMRRETSKNQMVLFQKIDGDSARP